MSDEFANWNELVRLWHTHTEEMSTADVELHAQRQRRQMQALAAAEAACMVLSFSATVWIAMQTTMVALTAIVVVFYGVCAFLQHRLRREPSPSGGSDLLSSLDHSIAREEWNLTQFGIGRVVTFFTLLAIGMVASDHLVSYATTPAVRLWALLVVTFLVLLVLALNIVLTRRTRARKKRLESFALRMLTGPEFRNAGCE